MSEKLLTPLAKDEKQKRRMYKDRYGIDTPGPLSPEYVKGQYDTAYNYKKGSDRIAESIETDTTPRSAEARKLLDGQARQHRRTGAIALEGTLKDIEKYVSKNSGQYHEMAKADMEADFASRAEAEALASTLDDIKNLPEIDK